MSTQRLVAAVAAAVLMSGSTLAFADSTPTRKPVRQMSCRDFLLVEDAVKPELVFWAATYGNGNGTRQEGAQIDVDDTDRMVPQLVEQCKQVPQEPFWRVVKTETSRLDKGL